MRKCRKDLENNAVTLIHETSLAQAKKNGQKANIELIRNPCNMYEEGSVPYIIAM